MLTPTLPMIAPIEETGQRTRKRSSSDLELPSCGIEASDGEWGRPGRQVGSAHCRLQGGLTERRAVGVELGAGLICSVAVDVVRVSIKSLARSSLACKK